MINVSTGLASALANRLDSNMAYSVGALWGTEVGGPLWSAFYGIRHTVYLLEPHNLRERVEE